VSAAANRGVSLDERARLERFANLSDTELGAVAFDLNLPASPGDRKTAARMLAARNKDRRALLEQMPDGELAKIALDRNHYARAAAIDTLAARIAGRDGPD